MLAARRADCNLPISIDVSHQSRLSVSTTYHSCIGDALSDRQYQESVYSSYSAEHNDPQVEPEPITIEHYEQLRSSLRNPTHLELPNFRSDARARLVSLTRVQFLELAMDVHDEVTRIKANEPSPSVVPPRERSSPHRNEARQKILNLRPDLLEDLMSDIFHELGRRYPKFKETKASFDQERSFRRDDRTPMASPVAPSSMAPIVVNEDLEDLVMNGIMASVTQDLNQRCMDIISGTMSMNEIILVLGQHGCPDITAVLDIPDCGAAPIAAGGFGDIYQGQLRTGTEIAIKCPRFFIHRSEIDRSTIKAAARELHAWSKYNHPNVLELLGVARFRDRIAMISPWMKNGTMNQYISRTPNADRCRLCGEIASGVAYLHGMGTVHGDIKGLNVLISHDGTAKLIDFGNSSLKNSSLNFTGSQTASSFSIRWTAPELLVDGGSYTQEADIYALGMTILEAITGQVPFPDIKSETAVITRVVIQKRYPERPVDSIPPNKQSDALWAALIRCWSQDPSGRPLASEVSSQVGKIKPETLRNPTQPDDFGRLISQSTSRLSRRLR